MRIGIEAQRVYRSNKHGMDIAILETIRLLQEIDKVNIYYVFVRTGQDKCLKETSNFRIIEVESSYFYFEQIYLPKAVKKYKLDLLHCTSNTAPFFINIPLILTLHDVIFLENLYLKGSPYQVLGNLYRRFIAPTAAKNSWKIITVSEYSKGRIAKYIKNVEKKIEVVPNGVGQQFKIQTESTDIKIKYKLPNKFLFFMGSRDPRKNLRNVLKAFDYVNKKDIRIKLLISNYSESDLQHMLKGMNLIHLQRHILTLNYIPAEELPHFYSLSTIFLFPSLSEGFGIPVLEAMACGAPVITSSTTSLPEVAGNAAKLVNPNSAFEIADAIESLISDENARQYLIERGIERSKAFSWANTAIKILDVYKTKIEEYQLA